MPPPPPSSTLFPYTTLFRSAGDINRGRVCRIQVKSRYVSGANQFPIHNLDCDFVCFVRLNRGSRRYLQASRTGRSEEHTSELQSRRDLVCRLLLEKKKHRNKPAPIDLLAEQGDHASAALEYVPESHRAQARAAAVLPSLHGELVDALGDRHHAHRL